MIFLQLSQQLQSLDNLLSLLDDKQYTNKIAHLGSASIGGHTRHIIELLQCAVDGYTTGEVDYVNRSRNLQLENDRHLAKAVLQKINNSVKAPDKSLALITEEMDGSIQSSNVLTSYFREIVYNTEHTIHHLALIKVAIIDMKLHVVDNNFGMAYSTIKYKASLNNK